jgi:hypothetical protein
MPRASAAQPQRYYNEPYYGNNITCRAARGAWKGCAGTGPQGCGRTCSSASSVIWLWRRRRETGWSAGRSRHWHQNRARCCCYRLHRWLCCSLHPALRRRDCRRWKCDCWAESFFLIRIRQYQQPVPSPSHTSTKRHDGWPRHSCNVTIISHDLHAPEQFARLCAARRLPRLQMRGGDLVRRGLWF